MTRESRVIILTILTLLAFAAIIFVESGSFIPPIPLFEMAFLVVVLQFAWWNKKQTKIALFVSATGIFYALSSQLIWTFFLDAEAMTKLVNGPLLELFKLIFFLSIILSIIFTTIKQRHNFNSLLGGLTLILLVYSFVNYSGWILPFVNGIMMVSTFRKKAFPPFDLLWVLLFFLEGIKWMITFTH